MDTQERESRAGSLRGSHLRGRGARSLDTRARLSYGRATLILVAHPTKGGVTVTVRAYVGVVRRLVDEGWPQGKLESRRRIRLAHAGIMRRSPNV